MPLRKFLILALFTAIETYFFNEAIIAGAYLVAFFWAFLILRNLQVAFLFGKIVQAIDDQLKKKR